MAQCTLGRAFPTSKNLDSKDTWKPFDCIHLRFSIAKNSRPCHYLSQLWSTSNRTLSECIYRFPTRAAVGGWEPTRWRALYSSRSQLQGCHFCRSGPWGQNIWRRFRSSWQKVLHQSTNRHCCNSVEAGDGRCCGLSAERQPLPLQCPPSTAASLALCMMSKY